MRSDLRHLPKPDGFRPLLALTALALSAGLARTAGPVAGAVPGDSTAPASTLEVPANSAVYAAAPTTAGGTASDDTAVAGVTCRLYRYATNGNAAGFWNGDKNAPAFEAIYNATRHERPAASDDGFAHWTLALPPLVPGQYYLRATARDAAGNGSTKLSAFTVNDATPQVTINPPENARTYRAGDLPQAAGTASDSNGDGLSGVTLLLYRYATNGNGAGFWNGDGNNPAFDAAYNAATHERAASLIGADWTLALPALLPGQYWIRATARDNNGNWNTKLNVFTINDASPQVTIVRPAIGLIYRPGDVLEAGGTASDDEGLSGVTLLLYRYAVNGNTAGFWNGTGYAPAYDAVTQERATTLIGADWTLALPALLPGQYWIRATARDNTGNWTRKTSLIIVTNVAPAASVTLSPASPHTNDTLTAEVTTHDGDGDTVQLRYKWKKNDVEIAGESGAALDLSKAGNGDKGDRIAVEVTPNDGTTDGAVVVAETMVANSAPVADAQTATTEEDTATDIVLGAGDADGDPLSYIVTALPAHGKLYDGTDAGQEITGALLPYTLAATGAALHTVRYVPEADYPQGTMDDGADTFTFKANDGQDDGNEATVSITVTAVCDPPVARGDAYEVDEDRTLTVSAVGGVLANDAELDGETLSASKVNDPAHGTLDLQADGSFTYQPHADYNGEDSFTYKAGDGAFESEATVRLAVNAVNDAPGFIKGADQTVFNNAGAQTVANWATAISAGPDNEAGQALSFIVSNDKNGLFEAQPAVSADGTLTFTPKAGRVGSATVSVRLHDDGGTSYGGGDNGGADTSPAQTFTITVGAPPASIITGIAPTHGATGAVVTITGTGFGGTTVVRLNGMTVGAQVADIGTARAGYQVVDDGHLKAIVPSSATTGKVRVTNARGTATSGDTFTVAPRVAAFTPRGGAVGSLVTINGSNFASAAAVQFNGVGAGAQVADVSTAPAGYQIVSDTEIKARVPAGATTGKISVANDLGDSGQSSAKFKVLPGPSIIIFTPNHGYARESGKPGTLVTLTGAGFASTTKVRFHGVTVGAQVADAGTAPAGFQIVDDNHIRARVPEGATTGKISVTNADGTAPSSDAFTVDARSNDVKLPAFFNDNMILQRGVPVPVWGEATPGAEVSVYFADQMKRTAAGDDGHWKVALDPLPALESGTLRIEANSIEGNSSVTIGNVAVGEVWLCSGQSNMTFPLSLASQAQEALAGAGDPQLRLFTVGRATAQQPQSDATGEWFPSDASAARDFSAVAYFFGRELRRELNVPVGLVHSACGGTPAEAWTSPEVLQDDPDLSPILERWAAILAANPGRANDVSRPGNPYHAMIAPLAPFALRGVIWYQGENNVPRAYQYRKLLPALIADWRRAWGVANPEDFPFYIVQLANVSAAPSKPAESARAELREAQAMAAEQPGNGLAVTIDIGQADDIHPKNKRDAGIRLGRLALARAYGQAIEYSGPVYDGVQIEGNQARLRFRHAAGLMTTSPNASAVPGFAIAGADRQWVWANARIEGEDVIVWSSAVPQPVAVRYAWANNPKATLYNAAGLPAVPFRTDDWPGLTINDR